MNSKELKVAMIRAGKSFMDLCIALKISRSAWFRKMNGTSQFTQKEIAVIRDQLELDDHQTAMIFFNP